MISKKRKIRDYAKDLFLQVDDEGNRVNTFMKISTAIQKKFKIDINYSTIAKWSTNENWAATFEKIKMAGIELGKEQLQEKESKLIDEKAQTIADIYKSNKTIQKLTQQTILSRLTGQELKNNQGEEIKSTVGTSDLVRLLQYTETTILNLHDKRTGEDVNVNIQTSNQLPPIVLSIPDEVLSILKEKTK
jgi:hypothetical protein